MPTMDMPKKMFKDILFTYSIYASDDITQLLEKIYWFFWKPLSESVLINQYFEWE